MESRPNPTTAFTAASTDRSTRLVAALQRVLVTLGGSDYASIGSLAPERRQASLTGGAVLIVGLSNFGLALVSFGPLFGTLPALVVASLMALLSLVLYSWVLGPLRSGPSLTRLPLIAFVLMFSAISGLLVGEAFSLVLFEAEIDSVVAEGAGLIERLEALGQLDAGSQTLRTVRWSIAAFLTLLDAIPLLLTFLDPRSRSLGEVESYASRLGRQNQRWTLDYVAKIQRNIARSQLASWEQRNAPAGYISVEPPDPLLGDVALSLDISSAFEEAFETQFRPDEHASIDLESGEK